MTFNLNMKQRKPSALMVHRQEILDRLEKLIGDDQIAGTGTPWKKVVEELRKMSAQAMNSLAYRVERAIAEAEKNAIQVGEALGKSEE